ncbi:hypothetical protein HPB48_006065 [Haemaphysalis longicornis]|uniref:Uncharacterized protein n=1 Tax=Haemaphysalis longicornis TaxID=44386 RepID=A0A9J6FVM5_HAELO|nr:hypothetical protein HPB48_006065 [Haemaphysalis longicornis]
MSSPALLPHKTQVIRQGTIAKTCQPFYAGFRIIGRFHRLVGCSFLENLPAADYERVRAKRASLYLLYQLFIWSFLLRKYHAMLEHGDVNKS